LISGTAWGAAHILPGILLGQALAFAGELSGRLLFALMVLFTVLAIGGWLVRLIAGLADPHRHALQRYLSTWAQTSRFPSVRRFGLVMAPENPNSILFLLSFFTGVLAVVGLADLLGGLIIRQAVGDFDQSLFNFFSELRSVPGDELFIRLSMLGDEPVLYAVAAVPVIWLLFVRKWRAAWTIVATILIAKLILVAFSIALPPHGLGAHAMWFRFPSSHALMAGTVLGTLGICCARGLSRWSQALLIACFAMFVVTIGFSRLYLGVNWFSDVVGGILIASIIVVLFSVAISTVPFNRVRPLYLLSTALVVFTMAATFHITHDFDRQAERYQPLNRFVAFSTADFVDHGWSQLPSKRINMMGRVTDQFVMQWVGPLPALKDALSKENYKIWGHWGWHDIAPYLNERASINDIAPRPLVHAGLRAKLTATLASPNGTDQRFVLRAFQSNIKIASSSGVDNVYLIYFREEAAHNNMGLYALPMDHPATTVDVAKLIDTLQKDPNVETLATHQKDGVSIVIMQPKS